MSLSKLWELAMDGRLARCSPWGRTELDTAGRLNCSSGAPQISEVSVS